MNDNEKNPQKIDLLKSIGVAGGCVLVGFFFNSLLTGSTGEFRGSFGIVWALIITGILAVLLVPAVFILAGIVSQLGKRNLLPDFVTSRLFISAGLAGLLIFVGHAIYTITPKARFSKIVGISSRQVSEVESMGFDSFLASRWLVAFTVSPEHARAIALELGLQEIDPIDLRERLRGDLAMATSPTVLNAPGPNGTRAYIKSDHGSPSAYQSSGSWITFVFSESENRAWFYKGFQN